MQTIEKLPSIDIYNIYGIPKKWNITVKVNIQIRLSLEIIFPNKQTQIIPITTDSKGRYRFDFGKNGMSKKIYFFKGRFYCKRVLMRNGIFYKAQTQSKLQRELGAYIDLLFDCNTDTKFNRFCYLLDKHFNLINPPAVTHIKIQVDSNNNELSRNYKYEYDAISQTMLDYLKVYPPIKPTKRSRKDVRLIPCKQMSLFAS